MVYYSDEIADWFIDIYFKEFTENVKTPYYYKIKDKLSNLDKSYLSRPLGRYPAWKQDGWYEIQIGCYILGYRYDGINVSIEECFKEKEMCEEYTSKRLYESIIQDVAKVVKRHINNLLDG